MIGKRIKEIRKAHGLTQKELAAKLKINDSSLSKIEKGINNPAPRTVTLLCNILHISEEWLREGKGKMIDEDHKMIYEELQGESDELRETLYTIVKQPNGWEVLYETLGLIKTKCENDESYSFDDVYSTYLKVKQKYEQNQIENPTE